MSVASEAAKLLGSTFCGLSAIVITGKAFSWAWNEGLIHVSALSALYGIVLLVIWAEMEMDSEHRHPKHSR